MCARSVPQTSLSTGISDTHTLLCVNSTADFESSGIVIIGAEVIDYAGKTGTQFTTCTRGADSTLAVPHLRNDSVKSNTSTYSSTSSTVLNNLSNVNVISSSPTTLDETYGAVLVNAASAAVNLNLPAAANASKVRYTIMKLDATANPVNIIAHDTETINGLITQVIGTQYGRFNILCDSTSWYIF